MESYEEGLIESLNMHDSFWVTVTSEWETCKERKVVKCKRCGGNWSIKTDQSYFNKYDKAFVVKIKT